jgi:hypothetical protein
MPREPRFKAGDHVYMVIYTNVGKANITPVKVTAVKRLSQEDEVHGEKHKYNVKITGTKQQKQNVRENQLAFEKPPPNNLYEGGRRKTRRTQRKRRGTRRIRHL